MTLQEAADENNGVVDHNQSTDTNVGSVQGPLQLMFESEVDRIFSTPIGAWVNMILHIEWPSYTYTSC